ncbi:MAG: hypothetical protein IPM17_04935 [Verrucomicrobia bacterium]|nr:hypothetical protein [Verrucomicrobiota bacterium]
MPLTNNVVDRVPFSLSNGSDTTLTTYGRNNLFLSRPRWRLQEVWHQQLGAPAYGPRT